MRWKIVYFIDKNNRKKMSAHGFNASFGNNHPASDRKGQAEMRKIFCAYHSTEFLTNFCIDKDCLMPLCPTCVVQHTEQHYECQQRPAYVNLHDAMQDSRQKCYANIIRLEEFNRKNVELSNYIQGLPDYIRKQLAECKDKLFHFIDQKFQTYENQLIDEIRAKYAQDGVYSRKECEQVREYIVSEIEGLYDKIMHLKGDQCLSALIRFYESDEKMLEDSMGEVADYIEKNKRAGGLYISLNTEELTRGLENICEKVVSLEFMPEQPRSLGSTRNLQNNGTSNKKVLANSIVNRVGASKSNVKQKSSNKGLTNSHSYSSRKQEKVIYPSPFKNIPDL